MGVCSSDEVSADGLLTEVYHTEDNHILWKRYVWIQCGVS